MDFFFSYFLGCRKFESLSELEVLIIQMCRKVNIVIITGFSVPFCVHCPFLKCGYVEVTYMLFCEALCNFLTLF